jgi:hypothetical protein
MKTFMATFETLLLEPENQVSVSKRLQSALKYFKVSPIFEGKQRTHVVEAFV